jgi:hypothetical protein
MSYMVDGGNYGRMIGFDCSAINPTKLYEEFLYWDQQCLNDMDQAGID